MILVSLFFAVLINPASIQVQFTYPPTYPDVVPEIAVTSHSGLSEHQLAELEVSLNDLVCSYVVGYQISLKWVTEII